MPRVKKAVHALKKRRTLLKKTKGYRFDRSRKERAAREALHHTATYSFDHRRDKKNDFRRLWNVRINGALDQADSDLSYSRFIKALKDAKSELNRKMLSQIAAENPESFKRILGKVSS